MTDTSKMAEILGRMRTEKNGAVVDSMRERGIVYPMSYGVSIPTVRSIAEPYHPDHKLAKHLWQQQVRELRLAAIYIADPGAVIPDELGFWTEGVENIELAEHLAAGLLGKSNIIDHIMTELLPANDPLQAYTALLSGARSIMHNKGVTGWKYNKALESTAMPAILGSGHKIVWQGITALLTRLLQYVPESRQDVADIIAEAVAHRYPCSSYLAEEIEWISLPCP